MDEQQRGMLNMSMKSMFGVPACMTGGGYG